MRKTLTIALTTLTAVIMLSCGNNIMEDPPREKTAWKDDNTYLAVIKGEGETKQDAKLSVVAPADELAAKLMITELLAGVPEKPENYTEKIFPFFKEEIKDYPIVAQPQEEPVYKEEGGKQVAYVAFIVEGENLKSEVKARALKALEKCKAEAEKKAEKSEETSAKPAEETVKEPVDETDKTATEEVDTTTTEEAVAAPSTDETETEAVDETAAEPTGETETEAVDETAAEPTEETETESTEEAATEPVEEAAENA